MPRRAVFVSHNASRSGAPLLLLAVQRVLRDERGYSVATVLMDGGPLEGEFRELGPVLTLEELAALDPGEVDLVYLNTVGSAPALAHVPPGVPVCCHVHELDQALNHWITADDRAALRARVDRFLVVSERVRGAVVRCLEVDPDRISLHYGFVDVAAVRAVVPRRQPGDGPVVGSSGTTEWRKGPDLFLALARSLAALEPAVRCTWVGGAAAGPEIDPVLADRDRLGLTETVAYVGEQADARPWFAGFDVFALMSREDPFPLACLEAAALGVPVVAFDCTGATEFLADGCGVVVPYPDVDAMAAAAHDLLHDPRRRAEIVAAAGARVEAEHDRGVAAPRLADEVERLVASRGGGDQGAARVAGAPDGARAPSDPPEVVFVSHEATLTGAPVGLLQLLSWLRANTDLRVEVVVLDGGPLEPRFAEVAPVRSLDELVEAPPPVLFLNSAFSARVLERSDFPGTYVIARIPELGLALDHVLPDGLRHRLFARADRFVAVADRVRRHLVEQEGVPADRVTTIHGAIPVDEIRTTPEAVAAARRGLGLPDDCAIVGAVGVRSWRKGVDLFVELAATVTRRRPDAAIRFVWLGGGDGSASYGQIQDVVDRAGLVDRVVLLEDREDPTPVQAMADVVVSTSREDPFPRVCLEAAALERPLVAFDSGGVEELLVAAGGRVVPYADVDAMADRVLELLDDPERAAAEGARLATVVRERHDVAVGAAAVVAELRQGLDHAAPVSEDRG